MSAQPPPKNTELTAPTPISEVPRAATPSPDTPAAKAGGSRRRVGRFAFIGVILLALVAWGALWTHQRLQFVHEIDARVVADVVTVGARVDGWITDLAVQSGDAVKVGDVVAAVDARDARFGLADYEGDLGALRAERARVNARRALVDEQTKNREGSERARLLAANAAVDALSHEVKFARSEFERALKLSKTGVVSTTSLERARTEFLSAQQGLAKARADVATAKANVDLAVGARKELEVLDQEATMLDEKSKQMETRIARQALVVDEHNQRSPIDGVVSKTFVLPGEYVRLGQRIALIHDPRNVWVEANIRETEVGRLQVGQLVDVSVDAYPDAVFEGTVERIGHATTGEFALLPSPNPSGNFTKVTQRIPVRISVSVGSERLRPGMLVEVDIHVQP
ncbi:MAG: HlyD family secretion protein [Gammaproteobacteria bacterium]|nr:HlyD family secretion protein [Gammaproteobacteria bacterium]